jgi:hypothetical protein
VVAFGGARLLTSRGHSPQSIRFGTLPDRACGEAHKIPSSKLQAPEKLQAPSSKTALSRCIRSVGGDRGFAGGQTCIATGIGIWSLGFLWSLVFGAWSFANWSHAAASTAAPVGPTKLSPAELVAKLRALKSTPGQTRALRQAIYWSRSSNNLPPARPIQSTPPLSRKPTRICRRCSSALPARQRRHRRLGLGFLCSKSDRDGRE